MGGPDIAAAGVAKATSNANIRLAIDGVAGESTASLSSCLAPGGTVVLYSFTSGKPGFANGIDLVFRNTTIRGFWLYSRCSRDLLRSWKVSSWALNSSPKASSAYPSRPPIH
jgi:NADPH:quinone reductase-like Zn-dependent oxidoreductase